MKKLRAYFWKECDGAEHGIVLVAYNSKDAKKMGYNYWSSEVGVEQDTFIEQKINWIKEANVEGIKEPEVMDDYLDGLKRNMYGYIEEDTECSECNESMGVIYFEDVVNNKIVCESCRNKKQDVPQ